MSIGVIYNTCVFVVVDEVVSVALVPLTEENETAMEDSVFTDFLTALGVNPPANEQVAAGCIVDAWNR